MHTRMGLEIRNACMRSETAAVFLLPTDPAAEHLASKRRWKPGNSLQSLNGDQDHKTLFQQPTGQESVHHHHCKVRSGQRSGLTSVPRPLRRSSPAVWDGCLRGQSIRGLTAPGLDDALVSCFGPRKQSRPQPSRDTNLFIYMPTSSVRGLTLTLSRSKPWWHSQTTKRKHKVIKYERLDVLFPAYCFGGMQPSFYVWTG